MTMKLRYVGLDVHVESIMVAVADEGGEAPLAWQDTEYCGSDPQINTRLEPSERLRICYEGGLCGFVLYWQLHEMNVYCAVIAPSLIAQRSGERVRTDPKPGKYASHKLRGRFEVWSSAAA